MKDSVCLVTGSGQGLGKAFVVRLLQAGARWVGLVTEGVANIVSLVVKMV